MKRDGPDAEDHHCLRAKDFRFRVRIASGVELKLVGGEQLRDFLRVDILISGVKGEDEALQGTEKVTGSRANKDYRRVVTVKDLRHAIKDACVESGFNPKNLTPKSLRKGFATHMTTCGVSRKDMVARAGWSLRSKGKTWTIHYIRSFARGPFRAAVDLDGQVAGLGPEGTSHLLPPSGAVSGAR